MRIFFSVGEPSGDLHASNLIRELKKHRPDVECVGYGGPKMQEAGCRLLFELTTLAVMFFEALKKLPTFLRLSRDAGAYFREHQVDAVVLIDYAGFNWWIARRAKKCGIPVFFYGVPQMWAWAPWRIRKLRRTVDHVLCKLPFEKSWFEQRGCKATYVGHPYFDQLDGQTYDSGFMKSACPEGKRLLTLLPGSRNKEVDTHLPILLSAAQKVMQKLDDVHVAVAAYNPGQQATAEQMIRERGAAIPVYSQRTPELMQAADACMACSGSVSLELMYRKKPTVIVYRVSRLVMFLQRFMLRVKFITLVNLIATKEICRNGRAVYDPDAPGAEPVIMPEYLTTTDCSEKMSAHIIRWFSDPQIFNEKTSDMEELVAKYAVPGATRRAARYILGVLRAGDDSNSAVDQPDRPEPFVAKPESPETGAGQQTNSGNQAA